MGVVRHQLRPLTAEDMRRGVFTVEHVALWAAEEAALAKHGTTAGVKPLSTETVRRWPDWYGPNGGYRQALLRGVGNPNAELYKENLFPMPGSYRGVMFWAPREGQTHDEHEEEIRQWCRNRPSQGARGKKSAQTPKASRSECDGREDTGKAGKGKKAKPRGKKPRTRPASGRTT